MTAIFSAISQKFPAGMTPMNIEAAVLQVQKVADLEERARTSLIMDLRKEMSINSKTELKLCHVLAEIPR